MLYRSHTAPLGLKTDFTDANFDWDLVEVQAGEFHILSQGKSIRATVLQADYAQKSFQIRIHGATYTVQLADRFDLLAEQLGFGQGSGKKAEAVKAPMPGLVRSILVQEGAEVKKGDSILILEAMKMENVLKAPADAQVKRVKVSEGQAVDKNAVLIEWL